MAYFDTAEAITCRLLEASAELSDMKQLLKALPGS